MPGRRFSLLFILALAESSALAVKANLKVGIVRPKTGPMAPIGEELHNGVMLAYKKLQNSKQPNASQRIKIIDEDDAGMSSTATKAAETLINRHRVHLLIGSVSNTLNHAIADVASRKNKLLILPIGTDSDILAKGTNIFSVSLSEAQQGAALGKFASTFLKKTKALIMEEVDNPYSKILSKNFISQFKKSGGLSAEVVKFGSEGDTEESTLSQAAKVEQEVTFYPGFYNEAKKFIMAFKEKKINSVFIGGDGWDTFQIRDIFGADFSGHYYYTPYSANDPHPAMQRFIRSFELEYKKPPSLAAFAGYEAFNLAVFAYQKVKSNRTSPLQSFLSTTRKLPSLTGQMKMSPTRNAIKPATIMVTTPQGSRFMTRITP